MNKYYLILNPTAQSGRGKKLWPEIFSLLDREKLAYEIGTYTYAGHSVVLAQEAALTGKYQGIVAIGGDGTINEVLNGLRQACQLLNSTQTLPAFGIIYTGTSPDICKYHKIPLKMTEAVANLKRHRVVMIDVGEVIYKKNSTDQTSWFLCSVNLGIGASVADGSNSGLRRYFGDLLGTFFSIILSVLKYKQANLKVRFDGQEMLFEKTLNMAIGKNPLIASGVKVDVEVLPDDGKMYLFSINNMGLLSLLFNVKKIYDGSLHRLPSNKLIFINSFACDYSSAAPDVEFDGDPQGKLPCSIKLLPKKIGLIK